MIAFYLSLYLYIVFSFQNTSEYVPSQTFPSFSFRFYCWNISFFAEILKYSTIIIESALDTPTEKLHQGPIIQHYEIETTPSDTHKLNQIDNDHDHDSAMTITNVHIKSANDITIGTTPPNEVVSYQRFGRVDKKTITYPFKCHLCGFSCRFKQSLLSHFKQVHPY